MVAVGKHKPEESNTMMSDSKVVRIPTATEETKRPYSLDDNVPIPSIRSGRGRAISPLRKFMEGMNKGQSFLVKTEKEITQARALVGSIQASSRRKYITRAVDGGVRIWRTE
jgi:hypothetical protein